MIKHVLCVGAGYVGVPAMAVMANHIPNLRIQVIDQNKARIQAWQSDAIPIHEPGLSAILERTLNSNLFFDMPSPAAYQKADIIFICVNTPTKSYGAGKGHTPDLTAIECCARDIGAHAKEDVIVVECSTVPVDTSSMIADIIQSYKPHTTPVVLSNPEFLAEGTAIVDLTSPSRVLIGAPETTEGAAAAKQLAQIYTHWVPEEKILHTNLWSSELTKLAANAFLAQRVSSINAISGLCEAIGANIDEVAKGVGSDPRIGAQFLEAGIGFGGSCFRKDLLCLVYILKHYRLHSEASYWQEVIEENDAQIARFAQLICSAQFHTLNNKRIAVLGCAFKPDTDDTRDSPALALCRLLAAERAHLVLTDPKALDNAKADLLGLEPEVEYEKDPYRAAAGAYALILTTHWADYLNLDFQRIYNHMQKPAFIFDGRGKLNRQALFNIGFEVYSIGHKPLTRYK